MTTKLDPPHVPPLSPSQRDGLRRRVMTAVDPMPRSTGQRRWAAPAIAVAAVGAVVAGTLVIGSQFDGSGVQPAAGPSTPASTPSASTPTAPRAAWLPKVDLGPVSPAEAARAANACKLPGAQRVDALWSRRVAIPGGTGPASGVVVLTKSTPGQPGGTYDLGIFTCFAGSAGAAVHDTEWKKQTSPGNPAVILSGMGDVGGTGDRKPASASYENILRVDPRIARIESRFVWAKGQGKWTQGAVAGGFAYTHSTALIPPGQYQPTPDGKSDLHQQYRAYDAAGKPVPINP
ncbi:hypothetical protein [Kribbella italica]|uniref:Uncharacterized protein n=1 Tax=Kribbella italica TaxID=1540520 RepID=A0A7W9MTC7_9ACTN|nr:hypothetical protein [Kribbella italica]MBB5834990.1 hypothetical protein [Kribbella italica]